MFTSPASLTRDNHSSSSTNLVKPEMASSVESSARDSLKSSFSRFANPLKTFRHRSYFAVAQLEHLHALGTRYDLSPSSPKVDRNTSRSVSFNKRCQSTTFPVTAVSCRPSEAMLVIWPKVVNFLSVICRPQTLKLRTLVSLLRAATPSSLTPVQSRKSSNSICVASVVALRQNRSSSLVELAHI